MAASTFPREISSVSPDNLGASVSGSTYDAVVVLGPAPLSSHALPNVLRERIAQAEKIDATLSAGRSTTACLPVEGVAGGRLVLATTDALGSWEADVRAFSVAAAAGITRAVAAGAKRPLIVVIAPEGDGRFERAQEVALLGALGALWKPLEARLQGKADRVVESVGIGPIDASRGAALVSLVSSLEQARVLARDITGTEPEVMAPEGMARACLEAFEGSAVKVEVVRDQDALSKGYPLLAAVARASLPVERHHARVIRLEYTGEGPTERTIYLAGKGLTYDTGGADLKTDGHMAGMSRDKGGAGAVAGLFKVLAERKPRGVKVVGLLGAVRNSIGSNAFVTDEIVIARSKVRVRIGNTDAEGRLVLADLLAALLEEAAGAPSPTLISLATLTGHAALAHGPYSALVGNGAARQARIAETMEVFGDAWGDPCAPSRLRPEDYAFIVGKSAAEDVLSCNSAPSARTPRGHQFPAAFLDVVSGLRVHNATAKSPIPFVHMDIAGSAVANGNWQSGTPTGAPVIALAHGFDLL